MSKKVQACFSQGACNSGLIKHVWPEINISHVLINIVFYLSELCPFGIFLVF
jgi:hypothetical protein